MRRWLAFPIVCVVFMTAQIVRGDDSFIDLCELGGERTEFVAPLASLDDELATFATRDGDVVVFVEDNAGFLDEGATYRVIAVELRSVDADWTSHVNGVCTVEDGEAEINITEPDGTRLDTGWWRGIRRTYPVTQITIFILIVPLLTLAGVTINRLRFGAEHDRYADLPDTGEWVEFGDDPDSEPDEPELDADPDQA